MGRGKIIEADRAFGQLRTMTEVLGPPLHRLSTTANPPLTPNLDSACIQHNHNQVVDMAPQKPPPDEIEFDDPATIAGLPEQRLDYGNNIFYYFTSTEWFEPSSQNIALMNSLWMVPNGGGQQIMNDVKLWHDKLRDQGHGVRFMTIAEPQAEGQPWVMQRQNKTYTDGDTTETLVEGNWYTQGSKIFQAPSLFDVMQSRMVSDFGCMSLECALRFYKALRCHTYAADCRDLQEQHPLEPLHWLY